MVLLRTARKNFDGCGRTQKMLHAVYNRGCFREYHDTGGAIG